jgi:cag pathogenicity island protein 24
MKYQRLTKEQLEELHPEFINFLATQSITAEEWKNIKANKPEIAEQELDVFSDLVWEGVLTKVQYLENIAPYAMQLFLVGETSMHLIAVKLTDQCNDLTGEKGFNWFKENLMDESVELFTASKGFSEDKHTDIFQLILQGAVISNGELYRSLDNFIKTS